MFLSRHPLSPRLLTVYPPGTGDSARHDNDNKIPRTPSAIYQMNRNVAQKMIETFPNIPIVPNIGTSTFSSGDVDQGLISRTGNNDIWPHNGPSSSVH